MTDSMNFGPDWIRNLSSEGNTAGGTGAASRYQLADYRYGREEMLALFDRNLRPPTNLTNFKYLYSETNMLPLALIPQTDEERMWQNRPTNISGPTRGRGGSLERGGRINRGRGGYQGYGRPASGYDNNWGNGEQTDWSPRKEFNPRTSSMDNWRRTRNLEDDDGWRNVAPGRNHEKWGRSTSWRGDGEQEERSGPPERGGRTSWHETRGPPSRKSWDNEDHLPEWATEHPTEGGGTFDERGAFHGSDDESLEGRSPHKRESVLQKSTSQQHISTKHPHPPLSSSKSAMVLSKPSDTEKKKEDLDRPDLNSKSENDALDKENEKTIQKIPEKVAKEIVAERAKSEDPTKTPEKIDSVLPQGPMQNSINHRVEGDLEMLQNDFILKLVDNEEPVKPQNQNSFDLGGPVQPPPNLAPPVQDKWFYQDPQGQMQGPFANSEMAEWYKAGYFSHHLKVRRQGDERFFLLGELIALCGGANPFASANRLPLLKNDVTKLPDHEMLQLQYLSQVAAIKQQQVQPRVVSEPWNSLTLQQQELTAQRLMMQQQQVPQEIPFMQQQAAANPLMQMINQMQQANKLPGPSIVDKTSGNIPNQMDPHLQMHMGNLLLQNRMPTNSMNNHLAAGGLPTSLNPDNLPAGITGLQSTGINSNVVGGVPGIPIPSALSGGLGGINLPRPGAHSSVDQLNPNQDSDPLRNLIKQLQQNNPTKLDSLWQQPNQFSNSPPSNQWQATPDVPMSMWDVQHPSVTPPPLSQTEPVAPIQEKSIPKPDKEQQRIKEEQKELKKKKELEEKQAKKDAEEKRKHEQRKLELEKRAAEDKKRKEEERIKKELEKAKKDAEEKRMKELEEKRRLKEQRKAEEEARKKIEETKKQEEERLRREAKEQEERNRAAEKRLAQEQIRQAKAAPWSQSASTMGMSLADIQKAEKEKRAQETALQLQRQQLQEQQLQLQQQEKNSGGIQLSWAKKPAEPRKVKSLAEIQAEEQERLAKQAAEARLQKEKELPTITNTNSIWNSQNLTWANTAASGSQWGNSNSSTGFWDEPVQKQSAPSRPSTAPKANLSNSVSNTAKQTQLQQVQKPVKQNKPKKEESSSKNHNNNNNNNGPTSDEFMNWCYKTLSNMSTTVDIPTFVTFLRDIESAFDVREYCKEYLGENNATQQFANSFLEKRRSFKPKTNAHKDDMCSPAPAITPSSVQHTNDFQEVKGKNKKTKKSKMLKMDKSILGFKVTSNPDRINVGDRDYGDNS